MYVTNWPLHQVSGRQNLNMSVKGSAVRVNNLTVEMYDYNKQKKKQLTKIKYIFCCKNSDMNFSFK
jgi:hypothetical protein